MYCCEFVAILIYVHHTASHNSLYSFSGSITIISTQLRRYLRISNFTVNDFETNHKDADVLVEYTFDSYRYIQMFFKIKQDSVCLVGLNEYSVYRP